MAAAWPFGEVITSSPVQTRALGRRLGRHAAPGTVIALVGPLGAGKTQLAKGVSEGMEVTSVVNSPTFIIQNEHAGRLTLFHADAYRLADGDEARAAGLFDERHDQGVTVIEWADRLAPWLPEDRLDIELVPDPAQSNHRTIRWRSGGPRHTALAREARLAGAANR